MLEEKQKYHERDETLPRCFDFSSCILLKLLLRELIFTLFRYHLKPIWGTLECQDFLLIRASNLDKSRYKQRAD